MSNISLNKFQGFNYKFKCVYDKSPNYERAKNRNSNNIGYIQITMI